MVAQDAAASGVTPGHTPVVFQDADLSAVSLTDISSPGCSRLPSSCTLKSIRSIVKCRAGLILPAKHLNYPLPVNISMKTKLLLVKKF
jgi:hypothetical protein